MMTKEDIQALYELSNGYSRRMIWISIKNIFIKEKLDKAHWLDDPDWWHLEYEEDERNV